MPAYEYHARDERGKAVTGSMVAATPEVLAEQLKRLGYLVTRFREQRGGLTANTLVWHQPRVSADELVLFTIQLSKLVKVGIPLVRALATLEAQTPSRRLREAIGDVARHVEAGWSFSEALEQHPTIFSPVFISLIRAGELSGALDEILGRLASFGQRQAELREQIKTAMTYPCLLALVSIGIVGFLVAGIIPKFMQIYRQAGLSLPLPTVLLSRVSETIHLAWPWLLMAVAGLGLAGRAVLRIPHMRRRVDAWLLRLPVIGSLVRHAALARFARTLQTLASSGVPILESLAIVEQAVGNAVLAEAVQAMRTSVRQGGSLSEPLAAHRDVPPMAVQMIAVGESSGTLESMLGELADHYDQMVRHGIKRATVFVEPIFLAIMGGVVAFILASILLPLFRLVNVIH